MMDRSRRIRQYIYSAAALILILVFIASFIRSERRAEETFSVNANTTLSIDAGESSTYISVEERDDIFINLEQASDLLVSKEGDAISVATEKRGILIVELPKRKLASVSIHADSGGIDASDIAADTIFLETTSGSMMVNNTSSQSLQLNSSTGSIIATDNETEDASLQAASGRVTAIGIGGNVRAHTKSGEIYIVPSGDASIDASSVTGGVTIAAGERPVSWKTERGKVEIGGIEAEAEGTNEGATITVSTRSGSIRIR